jgi:putative CocE/NonD family hydrolase
MKHTPENQVKTGSNRKRRPMPVRVLLWTASLLVGSLLLLAGFGLLFPKTAQSVVLSGIGRMLPRYLAWKAGAGFFTSGPARVEEQKVPMRDGVQLGTDIYLPKGNGPFPTVVVRSPYSKVDGKLIGDFFVRNGYAMVCQDTRGRFTSEGEFYPFRAETNDGVDFTGWIKQQPWCNGKIGGFGISYLGFTQWALAVNNPDITAISPSLITANIYNGIYQGGAFSKLTFLHWSLTTVGRHGRTSDWRGADNIEKGYKHFPLIESDDVALIDIPFYNEWVSHPTPDAYWQGLNVDRFAEMTAPVFIVAGWYDFLLEGQLKDFQSFMKTATPAVRQRSRLLIGPWNHSFFNNNQQRYGIRKGSLELIPEVYLQETKAWFDHTLMGLDNGWDNRPLVRLYVLGKNEWRYENEWPPARAVYQPYYLHSAGDARTLAGDGRLDLIAPLSSEPADTFVYDPADPVPTVGGAHGNPPATGPADQRKVEGRPDVLVYTSAPLQQPVLVMGAVKARVFASSSAKDTDFTVKLVDVFPDSQALIVCEGVLRARYRNGLEKPELLRPHQTYAFDIAVGNTAVQFRPGHRIRIEVSSSNFPRYDPNPNTGMDIFSERQPIPATQRVEHTPMFPSALMLPVVPD